VGLYGHATLIKESSVGAETWLITQNLNQKKDVIEKLPSPCSEKNRSIFIIKMTGKLSWDHKRACFGFL